mmetsp:Transcript_39423/g.125153  ORF Transcript_39423/g.125153 Transcript_39423/m.125153 type:complete len:200 (+) Transcript_39423:242-841(+)
MLMHTARACSTVKDIESCEICTANAHQENVQTNVKRFADVCLVPGCCGPSSRKPTGWSQSASCRSSCTQNWVLAVLEQPVGALRAEAAAAAKAVQALLPPNTPWLRLQRQSRGRPASRGCLRPGCERSRRRCCSRLLGNRWPRALLRLLSEQSRPSLPGCQRSWAWQRLGQSSRLPLPLPASQLPLHGPSKLVAVRCAQ